MRYFLSALFCLSFGCAGASPHAPKTRELVHAYPPSGPVEVAGTAVAGKVLRTIQRHAAPAFTDLLAMHVAQTLQGASDPPVAVTRRPRQGGNDALVTVSSAAPDGRTLLLASDSRAFPPAGVQPVALVASMPYVLIAESGLRATNVRDFIRAAPARILMASAGERSVSHAAIESLRRRDGFPVEAVSYNGGIAALNAVVSKQVGTALVPLPAVLPYLGGGRIKVLAITEARRHPAIAHVQTSTEAGVGGLDAVGWFGIFAPAGTPRSVIRDLNALVAHGSPSAETREVFTDFGLRLEYRAADAFAQLLEREGSLSVVHPSTPHRYAQDERHRSYRGMTGITSREGFRPPS